MAKEVKHLKKEQLEALGLFHQFTLGNNFKTKKARYEEIALRLKQKPNTVISWIRRWYEEYAGYLKETEKLEKKMQKKCTFEGLTKKQTLYVYSRLHGKSQEEAKLAAGYSEKTEASKIENNPKIIKTLASFRKELLNDAKFGFKATLNDLEVLHELGKKGIDEVKIIEEHGAKGKNHRREVKRVFNLGASVQAKSKISTIMGYDSQVEEQIHQRNKEYLHKKRMDLRSQDREDKRLEMDIERFEVDRQKIMSEEKKSDPKKLIIEVLD